MAPNSNIAYNPIDKKTQLLIITSSVKNVGVYRVTTSAAAKNPNDQALHRTMVKIKDDGINDHVITTKTVGPVVTWTITKQ